MNVAHGTHSHRLIAFTTRRMKVKVAMTAKKNIKNKWRKYKKMTI